MFDTASISNQRESQQEAYSTLSEQCLQTIAAAAPVLKETLAHYGTHPLADYLDTLKVSARPSYQPRQDFLDLYYKEVASLLGESIGSKAVEEIDACSMVLTANHLGVDFFSQSVQSNLLFYLLKRRITDSPVVIPVIACGSIPLDNVTYPLGVLLYKLRNGHSDMVPKKFPVFSNKVRRILVNVAPPFDTSMVQRAQTRLAKMIDHEEIGQQQGGALQKIFEQDYHAPGVMALTSYSEQSLVVNNRIWQRLFAPGTGHSNIITLDMESIVSRLLIKDLANPGSLIWSMFMNPALRTKVIKRLNGQRACWDLAGLQQRLNIDQSEGIRQKLPASCGTVFFWGVNDRSRRVPLLLFESGKDQWLLKGTDDKGNSMEIIFSAASIISALQGGQLLPSIFTSFSVLAFARGLTCLGGYYQAEYLPMMQAELVAAMRETGLGNEAANLVQSVETGCYLSGMQTVMTDDNDGLIPAGPVEIIAGGGLTEEDLDTILALSVRDAHLASLFETIDDIAPQPDKKKELKQALAKNCHLLRDKVVVK